MSKGWQIFFIYWFLFSLPFLLGVSHRIMMAWYMFRTKGTWIMDGWEEGEPPRWITFIFSRRKKL